MKRIVIAALLLVMTPCLFAQGEQLLGKIKDLNKAYACFQSEFVQEETSAGTGKKEKLVGTLYFRNPDKMAMHYTQPETELLVINGDDFFMRRGKRSRRFNMEKNARMQKLGSTLLACMMGDVAQVASANDAEVSAKEDARHYVVTLTARKKQPRGYHRIMLAYSKADGLLREMTMEEFGGKVAYYVLTGHLSDGTIPENVFAVPLK